MLLIVLCTEAPLCCEQRVTQKHIRKGKGKQRFINPAVKLNHFHGNKKKVTLL